MHLTVNTRLNSFLREYSTPALESENPFAESEDDEEDGEDEDHPLTIARKHLTTSPIDIEISEPSEACCQTPTASYTPKGTYKTLAPNTKTYIVGPPTAKKAIFFLSDVFGEKIPTVQGADMLASRGDYLVCMPVTTTDEEGDVSRVEGNFEALKREFPCVERWARIGGGEDTCTSGIGEDCRSRGWKIIGIHQSSAADAKIPIPIPMLVFGDEPADEMNGFGEEVRSGEKKVDGARGDLEEEEEEEEREREYEKEYQAVLEILKKHL
ncbi:uncharacterized protein MYCFIDRAFT_215904 [Pseudocercospora fijiensis CIRAD86]|uniref:Dienelactone hydrolase domain-containing protein n=1 Tax=Pseudocercospora fijiensis (strain CIRAD86) TaxID=383855 RepID=M3AVZ3_PSEFD|nr:uncharacterized protein MYCFIDRAFT_215904 [Pseudocercospora fijiensis CIRAD86]EME81278.1 hypothetical protein MYCFIDRAFT_215904 [Pseudocercospora fijiensis CIRAD86]